MKIVKPYAAILKPWAGSGSGVDALRFVEWCGRISHRSEEAATMDSWRRFLEAVVLQHSDWSIVEHVTVSVDAVVDRGITHEWVRHRIAGYTQESTRFVNYEKKMPPAFIYPKPDVECVHCLAGRSHYGKDGNYYHTIPEETGSTYPPCMYDQDWLEAITAVERAYKGLLSAGWRPQEARSVFPNALASRIITTANLRSWRHFLIMRTSAEAHPQMRQVTIPLLADFQKMFPVLFDDIVANEKQSIAMRKAR